MSTTKEDVLQASEQVAQDHEPALLKLRINELESENARLAKEVGEARGALDLKQDEYVQQVGTWKIIKRLEEERDELKDELKGYQMGAATEARWGDEARKEANELRAQLSDCVKTLNDIAQARCPQYMAHPQSVWWAQHVQSKALALLAKLGREGVR